jgi:dsDNA-specific endonuclease/ATPase MutS2
MSNFAPNDPVHVAAIGKGVIREVRNSERYLVEINGLGVVASGSQLTRCARQWPRRARWSIAARRGEGFERSCEALGCIDLHGNTVYDAMELVIAFLNESIRVGVASVRIIHGRSSDKIKTAVHRRLKVMSSIRGFALDRHNPGVTVVML